MVHLSHDYKKYICMVLIFKHKFAANYTQVILFFMYLLRACLTKKNASFIVIDWEFFQLLLYPQKFFLCKINLCCFVNEISGKLFGCQGRYILKSKRGMR